MANKADFIAQIYRAGIAAGLTDAAARITATQAGIESNYGERAPGFNYFGITKGNDWSGPTISRPDTDGQGNPIMQQFRSYASPEEGIADRVAYMRVHFPAFNAAKTKADALDALQNGTYGKYYTAPRSKYETSIARIETAYLPAVTVNHPVPPATVPHSAPGVPKITDLSAGGTVGGQTFPANASTQTRSGKIKGVVLHHTGGSSLTGALGAGEQHVGAQYYIDKDGSIYRYSGDDRVRIGIRDPGDKFRTDIGRDTAGLTNDNTISVEIVGLKSEDFTQAQRQAALSLTGYLARTYGIDPSMIVGHGDIQGGAGGNKMPTEGVELAAYIRTSLNDNPALLAIEQAAPRDLSTSAMAYSAGGTKGALAKLGQMRADQAKRELYQSAAFGVREGGIGEGGGGPAKGPAGVERGKLKAPAFADYGSDVTDLPGTLADGTYATSAFDSPDLLHGGTVVADDVGRGPDSWFDAADSFGSTVVASSGVVPLPRERPPMPVIAPVPMPGRPADVVSAAPVPRQRPISVPAATTADTSAAPVTATAAPPPRLVKLPSGKTVQTGRYVDPKTGTVTIITAGPNGEAVRETIRQGFAGDMGPDTIAGKLLGSVVGQKLTEGVGVVTGGIGAGATEVGRQLGQATETVKNTVATQVIDLPHNLQNLGNQLGNLFGLHAPSPAERLRNIISTVTLQAIHDRNDNASILLPTDIAGDPVISRPQVIGPPKQPQPAVWATPLRLKGSLADTGHVGAALERAVYSEADTRIEQRLARQKIAAVETSTSTVKPPKGDLPTKAGSISAGGAAATVRPVTTRTVTELKPNPEYERWQRSQINPVAVATLQDIHDREDARLAPQGVAAVAGLGAAGAAAPNIAPAKPPPPKFVPVQRTITVAGKASAGQQRVAAVVTPRSRQMVTIASGRSVEVGARGTAQGGRYVYAVQPDGSIKNITTSRITSPAPGKQQVSSNPSATTWDARSGGWANNA